MSPTTAFDPDAAPASLPITVLMNAGSGNRDRDATRAAIDGVLGASGRDFRFLVARSPAELPGLARQAAAQRPGILAAAGGDGTINAVAAVALASGLPLAVIPLGTFNYFARDLGIPLDPAAAAHSILQGRPGRVAVGRVNGHLFLNNASLGLYRRLIQAREMHKRRFGRNRLVAMLSGLASLVRRQRPYRFCLEMDTGSLALSSLTVFFGRNVLQMEQLGLDEAECVARGELAVLALPEVGRLAMLGLVLRAALGALENASSLHQHCAQRVRVEWLDQRSRHVWVAVDGEAVRCDLPLLVESLPDALQVILPARAEPRA